MDDKLLDKFWRIASILLFSILIGIFAFWATAGLSFLNPTNVAWLQGGDPLQHYLGWAFYRNSFWSWPIGLNPMYGMGFSNSIVFTDSLPLLAIPLKVITQFLPYPFQYQGIWVLLCFILQAFMSLRLLKLITNSLWIQYVGTILFVFSPPLIFRLNLHENLMGHFIILAALYLNLKPYSKNERLQRVFSWVVLLAVAAMVHFYLFVIAVFLWLSDLASRLIIQKKYTLVNGILEIATVSIFLGLVVWQTGYFAIGGVSVGSGGYGDFRTNLLALFNSRGWSYWLRPLPLRDPVEAATGEGFQYMGAGAIFLLLSTFIALVKTKFQVNLGIRQFCKKYLLLIFTLSVLAILSFSNHIGFGPWNIRIPLPDFLVGPLSVVRSSSRLFWPLFYSILLAIVYCVTRLYSPRKALLLVSVAALIQVIDTSAGWFPTREKLTFSSSTSFNSQLNNPFWSNAGQHYKNVVTNDYYGSWEQFGIYASQNKMSTSITYLARVNAQKVANFFASINQQIYETGLNPQSLYVLRDWKYASDKANYAHIKYNRNTDLLARIDGFNVLAPGWKNCSRCPEVDEGLELKQLTPELKLNQVVEFTKSGNGRSLFILNGWGYTEAWGTWAIQPKASVVLPMPEGNPTKVLIKANAFLTASHPKQIIDISVNGNRLAEPQILSRQLDNTLEIPIPYDQIKAGEPVTIDFHSKEAISPQEAGLSADDRKLGIGLISIKFAR